MRVNIIGISRRHGTSAKTGNQYDMADLAIALPVGSSSQLTRNENNTYYQYGCKVWTASCGTDVFNKLEDYKSNFPLQADLEIEEVVNNDGDLVKEVIGITVLSSSDSEWNRIDLT